MSTLAIRAAEIALAAYSAPATVETAEVHCLIVEDPDAVWISLRGTKSPFDLVIDMASLVMRHDPIIGHVPEPWIRDAEQIFWRIAPKIPKNKPLRGGAHSKGAAELQCLAVLLMTNGFLIDYMDCFAPPALGKLNGIIASVRGHDYRHGEDPITDDEFDRGRPRGDLFLLPWDGARPLDPLDYHAMVGYAAKMAAVPDL